MTVVKLGKHNMQKGCFYWIVLGWWIEPTIFVFKLIISNVLKCNDNLSDGEDDDTCYYSDNDIKCIKEDLYSDIYNDIYDDIHNEIECSIRKGIQDKGSNKNNYIRIPKKENEMYDKEKGIYPSGEYLVGRDLPLGGYILAAEDGESACVELYQSYAKYKKEEDPITYKTFKKDYHIALMEENTYFVVENASIQKI